jgi:hypothetical protein
MTDRLRRLLRHMRTTWRVEPVHEDYPIVFRAFARALAETLGARPTTAAGDPRPARRRAHR